MTKSHIYLLCGLGLLAGIFGFWVSLKGGKEAGYWLTPSAILTAGSLIAAAIASTADKKNE